MKKSKLMLNQTPESNNLDMIISEFIVNCKARNLSPVTIDYYESTFNRFLKAMSIESLDMITAKTIEQYILFLLENENVVHSVNSKLRAIRRVLYFFMEKKHMPYFKVTLMKEPHPIKDTYSEVELKKLLKKPVLKDSTFVNYRNWVIVNFLMGTGCRLNTLINIKVKDLDFNNGFVQFDTTKNKHSILVPLSSTLIIVLNEYLKYRQPSDNDNYLFCSSVGEKIHKRTLQQSIADYNNDRGVTKTSIHMFRHSFAKMYILRGGNMFKLQKILGHQDLTMVRRYVNMFSDDIKNDFDSISPLEAITLNSSVIKINK